MNDLHHANYETSNLPYRIAVLCYLWNHEEDRERLLMLHRAKAPNLGMYSPIGGKVEISEGETPHECAVREIEEEAGLTFAPEDVHLLGVVAEKGYQDEMHWLLFLFEVGRPVEASEIEQYVFNEGELKWIPIDEVGDLGIPETDREVIWPQVRDHRGGGFFMTDIDCRDGKLISRVVDSRPKST